MRACLCVCVYAHVGLVNVFLIIAVKNSHKFKAQDNNFYTFILLWFWRPEV